MRTITIDDGVFAELQRQASKTGVTISHLIEQAVRRMAHAASSAPRSREKFRLVTFGQGGRFSPHDIDGAIVSEPGKKCRALGALPAIVTTAAAILGLSAR